MLDSKFSSRISAEETVVMGFTGSECVKDAVQAKQSVLKSNTIIFFWKAVIGGYSTREENESLEDTSLAVYTSIMRPKEPQIRRLLQNDDELYRAFILQALDEECNAFPDGIKYWQQVTRDFVKFLLGKTFTYGAFPEKEALAGIVKMYIPTYAKTLDPE